MWSALIITAIIASIAVCINLVSNTLLRSNVLESSRRELNFVASQTRALITKVENESLFFIMEEAEKLEYTTWENASKYEQMLYRDSLSHHLRVFFNTQSNLISAAFYDRNGLYFYRDKETEQITYGPAQISQALTAFHGSDKQKVWQLLPGPIEGKHAYTLLHKTYNIHGVYRGILILQIDPVAFSMIYKGAFSEGTQLVILDPYGQICFSSMDDKQTDGLGEALLAHAGDNGAPFHVGGNNLALGLSAQDLGLYLSVITSETALYRNSHILVGATILMGLFAAILSKLLLGHTTKKLLSPLADIVDKVQQLSDGNYAARIIPYSNDELASLSLQINQMAQNTQELMEQIQQKGELRKKYEIAYLQLQMQPHFLYNALETVNGMIALGEQNSAIKMINYLSNFYRGILNYGEAIITIDKELEIAKNYLRIMQNRYRGRFSSEFQIQERVLSYNIPKLILQPLLENSIVHGFSGIYRVGKICVRANMAGEAIILAVEDDGKGFLRSDAADWQQPGGLTYASFGLRSIEERLKLYYGETARLKIDSTPGQGTCVTLFLPTDILFQINGEGI